MSDKWYEEIPQQGVLCICYKDIIAVIYDYKENIDCPFVSIGQRFSSARPLNVDEWWKFAPWQQMKDAPLYEAIIVYDYKIKLIFLYNNNQRGWYEKWLPLPKEL